MANPAFPALTKGSDSKYFKEDAEDPSMVSTMDGGYVVSRARFTRPPRRIFTTGYTAMSDADKTALQNFYRLVAMGGSVIFDWTHPDTGEVIAVRFLSANSGGGSSSSGTGGLPFQYTGMGVAKLWDIQFQLQEA